MDGSPVVLVGAPLYGNYQAAAFVVALTPAADSLDWVGTVQDDSAHPETSSFGSAIGISADQASYLVGAFGATSSATDGGLVYLLESLPDGVEWAEPALLLTGDGGHGWRLGVSVAFMDLDGTGEDILTAGGNGYGAAPALIYRFDRDLTGDQGLEAASATITGTAPRLGQYLARWDSDGDGLDEVVAASDQGAVHFASPWGGSLSQADGDVEWTDADPTDQLGEPLETLGDLDGDGLEELSLGAQTFNGPEPRSGCEYVVAGGALASSPAAELPTQVQGLVLGEGVGSAATSGDFDGDGSLDLVVGAFHVNDPHAPGAVLGYFGPIRAGIRTSADADFAATGEAPLQLFGSDVKTVDADGDAQADIVVGAQSWHGMGKVYLFLGADLIP